MICIAAILFALVMNTAAAHAHGGGLDKLGCHHNRKAGGYHCHRGALVGQNFSSKAEAAKALRTSAPPTNTLAGRASVIDGDTIEIHGQRIRLHGIGAPESGQSCTVRGKRSRCGRNTVIALAYKVGTRQTGRNTSLEPQSNQQTDEIPAIANQHATRPSPDNVNLSALHRSYNHSENANAYKY